LNVYPTSFIAGRDPGAGLSTIPFILPRGLPGGIRKANIPLGPDRPPGIGGAQLRLYFKGFLCLKSFTPGRYQPGVSS